MERNYVQQFKKGALEMVLLCLISRGETYGYEIIAELNRRGGEVLGYAREGTVYPVLYRLEKAGLIQCRISRSAANGRAKKYYSLTEEGGRELEELTAFWKEYTRCINTWIEDDSLQEVSE